jgi:riboflavin kinase/FMN adenylyltransferase
MAQIFNSLNESISDKAWLTIGSFDGVHFGHQEIIRQLVNGAHAERSPAAVLTFHPHPSVVLRGNTANFYLTLPEERGKLIKSLGVDLVIFEPFTRELAATSAEEYVNRLVSRLGLRYLLIGHDFSLGRGREGSFSVLKGFGQRWGFEVKELQAVQLDGEVVSSSKIRGLLEVGEVRQAVRWLGRPYHVSGLVVPGDRRGRTIGIPTANLAVPAGKLIPANGVYACKAWVDGRPWAAATNIGIRPTFDGHGQTLHVEAHLLDFSGDLYDRSISLDFIERLRGEKRFDDVQALIHQIKFDIQQTREIVLAREGLKSEK